MSAKVRPAADISKPLSAGPTACDAALENGIRTTAGTARSVLIPFELMYQSSTHTLAFLSCGPNGVTPLKTLLARPSQKLR